MRANQSAVPRIGDVQHQRRRVATGAARGVVDLGAGASGAGHREAVGGQAPRDGAADAAAAAGDERDADGHAVILTRCRGRRGGLDSATFTKTGQTRGRRGRTDVPDAFSERFPGRYRMLCGQRKP